MADDDKTFTQADVDKLMADLNTKHQEDMNALAGKLRAEFKDKYSFSDTFEIGFCYF